MMARKYYPKTWKYSIGCISADFYNGEKFEDMMYDLILEPEDYYRDTLVEIGNVNIYCRELKLHTIDVKRWIDGERNINYIDLYRLYNCMRESTICVYRSEGSYTPKNLIPVERITRSIEWFIHEGLMSYEYISWGTHINEGALYRWIDEWDFRGLTYSKLKRICDFVLDRLDKNALSEEGDEVIILLP